MRLSRGHMRGHIMSLKMAFEGIGNKKGQIVRQGDREEGGETQEGDTKWGGAYKGVRF